MWKNESSGACPECSVVMWHDSVREKKGEKNLQKLTKTEIQVTFHTKQNPVLTVTDAFKSLNAQKVVSFMGILFMPAVATQAK